ncbi:DNA replication and repair protein RecF, partial [Listeria monocytogenes]
FQKILKQRNAILRENRGKMDYNDVMFDVYTEQYIQVAVQIIRKRFYFMELLQKWAEPIHRGISRGMETLKVSYGTLKGLDSGQTKEEMESVLEQS